MALLTLILLAWFMCYVINSIKDLLVVALVVAVHLALLVDQPV